jgi:hypothetical protein
MKPTERKAETAFRPRRGRPFTGQPRRGSLGLVAARDPQVKTCGYPRLAPAGAISRWLILTPIGAGIAPAQGACSTASAGMTGVGGKDPSPGPRRLVKAPPRSTLSPRERAVSCREGAVSAGRGLSLPGEGCNWNMGLLQCLCVSVVDTVFAILRTILRTLTWPRLWPMMRRKGSGTV